jgi:hypothetical protein
MIASFQELVNFHENFNTQGSQDLPTGQNQNYTPTEYRSEHEEEKPGSREKNKLKAVIDELRVSSQLNSGQIKNLIGKLADVYRAMN